MNNDFVSASDFFLTSDFTQKPEPNWGVYSTFYEQCDPRNMIRWTDW